MTERPLWRWWLFCASLWLWWALIGAGARHGSAPCRWLAAVYGWCVLPLWLGHACARCDGGRRRCA